MYLQNCMLTFVSYCCCYCTIGAIGPTKNAPRNTNIALLNVVWLLSGSNMWVRIWQSIRDMIAPVNVLFLFVAVNVGAWHIFNCRLVRVWCGMHPCYYMHPCSHIFYLYIYYTTSNFGSSRAIVVVNPSASLVPHLHNVPQNSKNADQCGSHDDVFGRLGGG